MCARRTDFIVAGSRVDGRAANRNLAEVDPVGAVAGVDGEPALDGPAPHHEVVVIGFRQRATVRERLG